MIELYNGDCLIEMNKIQEKSVDLILADLPYQVTSCKWDIMIPFEPLWEHYKRVIKDNGAIVLFGSEPFASHLRLSNLKWYKYDWYWFKNKSGNFMNANIRPHKRIETVSVFYKKLGKYYPQKILNPKGIEKRMLKINTSKQKLYQEKKSLSSSQCITQKSAKYEADKLLPISLLSYKVDTTNLHPTQKPVALLEYLIKTYTDENDTVLDNVMGSGSTGVACINTNRNFIGIEMDENYFKIAEERINNIINKIEELWK